MVIHPVFVCSKGRPTGATFELFNSPIHIFVEPQEYDSYSIELRHDYLMKLGQNNAGIAYARNAALTFAREQNLKWFWLLDDDIKNSYLVKNSKCIKTSITEVLLEAQNQFSQVPRLGQGALEYQQFAWSARLPLVINSYCDVAVCINVQRTLNLQYRKELELKEDRDFTIQCLASGSLTARSTWTAFSAPKNGSNKGGLYDEYAKVNREKDAAQNMAKAWPGICRVIRKPSGRVDCKVSWNKFKA